MKPPAGVNAIASPALLVDLDRVHRNLRCLLEQVEGDPTKLRLHMKTHKCGGILRLQKELGLDSVKCATLAEAELAAEVGIADILIAYPLVGPSVTQLSDLIAHYPSSTFRVVVDSVHGQRQLEAAAPSGLDVLIDLDIGMHRTGISRDSGAMELAKAIHSSPTLNFAGIHAYDGHIHTADPIGRREEFDAAIRELDQFIEELSAEGIPVSMIVSGGTPTFPFHAGRAIHSALPWQCSPGTPVLWDAGYGGNYPDLPYEPAAFLLTRVISHPGPGLVCLDLGHKAVSAENPLENRVRLPQLENVEWVSQSEEHLVIRIPGEGRPAIGETLLGVPYHVCPSVALHDEAATIRNGILTDEWWPIEARTRRLKRH